jgi:hypothetical protein
MVHQQLAPNTDSSLAIAERFYQILFANKAQLGLNFVAFGDQNLIPETPSLMVEPGTKKRELRSGSDHTLNDIDTYFIILHSPVGLVDVQQARRENMAIAEGVERYLHRNHLRLFDVDVPTTQLTIHGYCVEMDPGFQAKQNTLYNAVQLTWRSTTKTWLGR